MTNEIIFGLLILGTILSGAGIAYWMHLQRKKEDHDQYLNDMRAVVRGDSDGGGPGGPSGGPGGTGGPGAEHLRLVTEG